MTAGLIDELSPLYVGAERIAVRPSDPDAVPRAFQVFTMTVDYGLCAPEGVMLPLEVLVTSPSRTTQTLHRYVAPAELAIVPDEGGRWLVTIREVAHNQWWGRLAIEVEGDRLR